jgi:two-component system LytT family response regulator
LGWRVRHQIVQQCANGREALAAIAQLSPDLMFLDIQMPGFQVSGLAQVPQESLPMIVFVTAFTASRQASRSR